MKLNPLFGFVRVADHAPLAAIAIFTVCVGLMPARNVVAETTPSKSPVQVIDLWSGKVPAWPGTSEEEHDTSGTDGRDVAGRPMIRLGHVSTPQLHVYPAASDAPNRDTMIIVCPGGGYSILAWDLEGTEIAVQFNDLGYSAAVLKYRVPTRQMEDAWRPPVQDVQRAISIARSIDGDAAYKQVGLVGFSAGGNAVVRAGAAKERFYAPVDQRDTVSCRPDFVGAVYPWLMVEGPDKVKPNEENLGILSGLAIDETTPPMFLAHAIDDSVNCQNSVQLFTLLQRNKVKADLHVYSSGGHGFGARDPELPAAQWPKQMATWLKTLP